MGDIISEFKIENANRPEKDIVYPFGLMLLLIFVISIIEETNKTYLYLSSSS